MDDVHAFRALGAASGLSSAFFVGQSLATEGERRERHASICAALGIASVVLFGFAWLGKQIRMEADAADQRYVTIMTGQADLRTTLNAGYEMGKGAARDNVRKMPPPGRDA